MSTPTTWRGVVNAFKGQPAEVRRCFSHLPKLAKDFPWEVSLSYLAYKVEAGQHMAMYCGVVKLHRAERTLARAAVEAHPMHRDDFRDLFKTVFGKELKKSVLTPLKDFEAVRDKIMHGKTIKEIDKRKAVIDVLLYARAFNDHVEDLAGFKPYGDDLRGFKGRKTALDKATTRWLLKGLGLTIS